MVRRWRLAILVRILMLVACVPLLQPTGFCVCNAAGSGNTTSPSLEPTEARTHSPTAPHKIGCCSHHDIDSEANKSAPSDSDRPAPCPTPRDDDHHMPGCPASAGVDRYKWVEPVQSFAQTLPALDVGTFLPLEFALPVAARPIPSAAVWPSSPPIYLTHCSLLI